MKNLLIFLIIFVCGGVSYALLNNLLAQNSTPQTNTEITQSPAVISSSTQKTSNSASQEDTSETELVTTKTNAGEFIDGPFTLLTNDNIKTDATVRIIRSPEETVLQFEHFTESFPIGSFVYLSDDMDASHYINLGIAQFTDKTAVYGLPPQWDQDEYPYILIYDTAQVKTVFSAKTN